MAFGPGSIAFVGFNADGVHSLAFVVLEPIAAGTQIHFTDDEWTGSALNTGESRFTWTATNDIAPGAIVQLNNLNGVSTSNLGTLNYTAGTTMSVNNSNEIIYAYVGTPETPSSFLAAIGNDTFAAGGGSLANTGLVEGTHAVSLATVDADADIGAYNGPRGNTTNFTDFLAAINNSANWIAQDAGGNQDADGIAPDSPFALDNFVSGPDVQSVGFAAGSMTVSVVEGDSGKTALTFTIVRSGTSGVLEVSGNVQLQGTVDRADFGGVPPMPFYGVIPDGQSSATFTIEISADILFERDETFTVRLEGASNTAGQVFFDQAHRAATAVITNDDPAPANIAFVGFNADGNDNLAFVALGDVAAGTQIHFSDNEWTGSAFNTGESIFTWTATSDIKAGTVITLDNLKTSPVSNLGTLSFAAGTTMDFDIGDEIVYAYLGSPDRPTAFLTAISNDTFVVTGATLNGTGLTQGVNAIALSTKDADADIAAYNGAHTGAADMADYQSQINNAANWVTQDTGTDDSIDAAAPNAPFLPVGFAADPDTQFVSFAPDSLSVSRTEGNDGTTTLTFTVQRSGGSGSTGDLHFTGAFNPGATDAADFGGAPPTFAGTILEGATSALVTITVATDTLPEGNEAFSITLSSAANAQAPTALDSTNLVATGTIQNDDPVPSIAFVGFSAGGAGSYNEMGLDYLAFVALSDLKAGTEIYFTDNEWTGSSFNSGESILRWTATSDIRAGTVITINEIFSRLDPVNNFEFRGLNQLTSNLGTITVIAGDAMPQGSGNDLDSEDEIVYAYLGSAASPLFLTAIANDTFGANGATLAGTGLTEGINAISLGSIDADADIAAYNGPRVGQSDLSTYLPLINNATNWITQDTGKSGHERDGIGPDAPFVPAGFATSNPATQFIEFAPGSVSVSKAEGADGSTIFTFTVQRTAGSSSVGDLAFTGTFLRGNSSTTAADFGGTLPTGFSGVIQNGMMSAEFTVVVKGDGAAEVNETFMLTLASATNAAAPTALGSQNLVATGTIVNDDPTPVIAFTGFSVGSIAFVVLNDIRAGTVIDFTNQKWNGLQFNQSASYAEWTATEDVAAGTVVTLEGLGGSPTSSVGSVAGLLLLTGADDVVYALIGHRPTTGGIKHFGIVADTFLAAITNDTFANAGASIAGTGLVLGTTALELGTVDADADIAAYVGPRIGPNDYLGFLPLINDPQNWVAQDGPGVIADGIGPDLPFSRNPFSDQADAQSIEFTANSLSISHLEGDSGTTVFTFTVQRVGSSTGAVNFTGVIASWTGLSADDFVGGLPTAFSGTIADGATTATVTIEVSGDTTFEASETFTLTIDSVSNASAPATVGGNSVATGTIVADEAVKTINSGVAIVGDVVVTGNEALTIAEGGSLTGTIIFDTPLTGALVDNSGLIVGGANGSFQLDDASPAESGIFTITNQESGEIRGGFRFSGELAPQGLTINNAGKMSDDGSVIDVNNIRNGLTIVNNYATGRIESGTLEAIRGGAVVNNWGVIIQHEGTDQNALDGNGQEGFAVNNYAGGVVEGSKHASTNGEAGSVFNGVGAVMIGHNGSAANWDNDPGLENALYVTNYGIMEGRSADVEDSDGDAIDADGLAFIDNWGSIKGLGHYGYHNGEANVSEGIAIGGGTINNYAGATIYGYGRAIQVDDSGNGASFAAMVIYNEGLIQGDGHAPTSVAVADAERLDPLSNEAIGIVGAQNDILTNTATGVVIGGVKMGGGNDTLTNAGLMSATDGSAIDLGEGNDVLTHSGTIIGDVFLGNGNDTANLSTGEIISGSLHGGVGSDTLNLDGAGAGALNNFIGFEHVNINAGDWSLGSDGFAMINFASGAQTLRFAAAATADGDVDGVIKNFAKGDRIDLKGIGLATSATLDANNLLTITGGANGPVTLQLDPAQNFTGFNFTLADNGAGGTTVTLEKPMGPGSIAFTGFNADDTDNLAFVVLEDITAGTEIHFTDSEWTGSAFNAGESRLTWTATSDVAAGTVITFDNLFDSSSPTVNVGSIAFTLGTFMQVDVSNEIVYAYVGTPSAPTAFLAAIANDTFANAFGTLDGTGLTEGVTAVSLFGNDADADIGAYNGPRIGPSSFADYLPLINDRANWTAQDGGGNQNTDGVTPDAPFSTAAFLGNPNTQFIGFAADSLSVSAAEGDAGTKQITFTVERTGTGGTTGVVEFSGVLQPGATDAADFGGILPINFTGTIADGANSGVVTITISGDTAYEVDELFTLVLQAVSNAAAPVALGAPYGGASDTATGTIVNDEPVQYVNFSAASINLSQNEGDAGTSSTLTFVIERTGTAGTIGDLAFSGTITLGTASDSDFDAPVPLTFSGVIPAGEASVTITLTIVGDSEIENHETVILALTSVANSETNAVLGDNAVATGTITNDDLTVAAGETLTFTPILAGNDHFVVEAGGTVENGVGFANLTTGAVLDNAGTILGSAGSAAIFSAEQLTAGDITILNHQSGVIRVESGSAAVNFLSADVPPSNSKFVLDNAGLIENVNGVVIRMTDFRFDSIVIHNRETGQIINHSANGDVIRAAEGIHAIDNYAGNPNLVKIFNDGEIKNLPDVDGNYGGDAIDFGSGGGTVINSTTGYIEGSRHAITASRAVIVENDGTIIGRNGSAINIDNSGTEANRVYVTNRGTLQGKSATYDDSDGDAIDTDGLATVQNYGTIEGLGHNGYHNGEPNISEGLAIGGGTVNNYAGARIYGYGRAIQVDDSENGDAFSATIIYNEGLIQGDGNAPTGVEPEDVAPYTPVGNEAINLVGDWADTITNKGTIVGGIKMGGGDDAFNAFGGSIAGAVDGGDGNDTVNLDGAGQGTLGALINFETVNVNGGDWNVGSDGFATVNFGAGAQTLRFAAAATADGDIDGVIKGFAKGDTIDLKGIGLANSATLDANNLLTITGGANGPVTLQFDPAQDFAGLNFKLADDGAGGTTITLEKPMGPGSIAFTGSAVSQANFVVLEDIAAGTEIRFTTNFVSVGDTSGSTWTWTASEDIAAGTVVTLENLLPANVGDPVSTTSNHGTITYEGPAFPTVSGLWLIAYVGETTAPTYVTAVAGPGDLDPSIYLTGTGLTFGVDAIAVPYNPSQGAAVIGAYVGPTSGFATFEDYQAALANAANWVHQSNSSTDPRSDGTAPDLPFPTTQFTNDPTVQTVSFDTLFVSVSEGPEGAIKTLTFTVSRSGSTTGDLEFSGSLVLGDGVNAADFGGTLPTFSGVIPAGAESVTVNISISGDISFEADETFKIKLDSVSNASSSANVGGAHTATITIVNDDEPQTVGFAPDSQSFTITEGNDGSQVLTFTVERNGSTLGELSFRAEFLLSGGNINAADFGGTLPTFFDGVMADGQSTATFSITVTGDQRIENNETFALQIISATNGPVGAVIGNAVTMVTITNDDPASLTVPAGTITEGTIILTGADHLMIEAGGLIQTRSSPAVTWSGAASSAVIDNYGTIEEVTGSANIITVASSARGTLAINNHAGATIETTIDLGGQRSGSTVTVENEGLINGALSNALRMSTTSGAIATINNRATGVITNEHAGVDVIRNARGATINNWGEIVSAADTPEQSNGYAINVGSNVGNTVHNYDGGLIEGSRSAITGKRDFTIINEAGGTIIGRNGSAVNWDNDSSASNAVRVTNYGLMEGRSTGSTDSDGDAVDVDGLAFIDNYGSIRGVGHNGYHEGEPNISEGIAFGGGTINNYAGATIYGHGRAIQVDNSENGNAFAATTIYNEGLIQGDGNAPTGVDPEDVAPYIPNGNEAINLVGTRADSITNKGQIVGGVDMGGGDDVFNAYAGSSAGLVNAGEGNDTLNLEGRGQGTLGVLSNFETVNVKSGDWSLGSDGFTTISFEAGVQTLRFAAAATTDGDIDGVIKSFGVGDKIDLKGIGLATGATLDASNALTLTGAVNGPITLQFDPAQNFSGLNFKLTDDGAGGTTIALEKPLGAGSIAFTGYNADGPDNLSFVVLQDIAAGTVITFTDNEWTGSAFNTGESVWTWTATSDIAAGSVITMDGLAAGQTATSNLGSIAFTNATQRDIANANETVYAYVGAGTPVFLAAISDDNFTSANGLLTNTGLVQGQTALSLTSLDADADIAIYAGIRGASSFEALLPLINNPANWISQDTAASDENDGTPPDLPFTTSPFVGEPNFQTIGFTGPLTVTQAEGDSGKTLFTFTVERSGGTVGAINFSGSVGGTTNGADFGGTKPLTFSGVIADGATSATVTIEVSGDTLLEPTETAVLTLTAVQNGSASIALGSSVIRTAIITDEDPYVVIDGQVYTGVLTVPAGKALTIEHGGTVQGDVILNNPGILPSLTNSGTITSAARAIVAGTSTALDFTGGITIVNNAGGLIEGATQAIRVTADLHGSTFKLINAGTIKSSTSETVRLDDAINGNFVVENLASGLIRGGSQQNDVLRVGNNTTIINAGTIENAPDVPGFGRGGDGVDFKSGTGSSLHNLAGGHIEASRHGVTGERGVTVVNDAGGVIVGRNGSAVNIDNDATVANTVYVTNYGLMQGKSANYEDSDGDAIDTDGLAVIDNYGTIEGLGHNGYHDGEPNVSEGIAIGGGVINNYAGGTIYGFGRAIQFDDSGNAGAYGAATINNAGLIKGDGNAPTAVTPEEVALFAERIRGGEAINILGSFGDTLTNTASGVIIGGVKMGGGDDIVTNKGTMTATGGTAIDMGDGADTFNAFTGSSVTGLVDGGGDTDTVNLEGVGLGTLGALLNFETLNVKSGDWSLGSDGFASINFTDGVQTLRFAAAATADGDVDGVIKSFGFGDVLDLKGIGHATAAVLGVGNVLTVSGGGVAPITLQLDPTADFTGLAFRASDDGSGGTLLTLDHLAVASNDSASATVGHAVNLNLLGNDTDEDGDALSALIQTGPSKGVLTQKADGSFDYVAFASGPDSFTYMANDGAGNSNLATVTINVGVGADTVDLSLNTANTTKQATGTVSNLVGGSGNDTIVGNTNIGGTLSGGNGNDTISGGNANDIIVGGAGNDRLIGRAGDDTFVFRSGFGDDTISDFQVGDALHHDTLDLRGLGFGSLADVLAATSDTPNAVISVGDDSITLTFVNKTLLASHGFDILL